jgi:hypothetical protein
LILAASQTFRFLFYDKLMETYNNPMLCSGVSALLLTTMLYPLDLSHTLMSADLTKKQSLYNQNYKSKSESQKPVSM